MSEYTQALTELVSLPRLLDERIARAGREVAAERARREAEIEAYAEEHEAMLTRLQGVLERARAEGVAAADAPERDRDDAALGAEPIEYARQLVTRLEESLRHILYTRDTLAREEESLSEEERRRQAEERRRREEEELRRAEQWERARQGSVWLAVALAGVAVAGIVAGAFGAVALLVVPPLAAVACFGLAMGTFSTLPGLASRRATGSDPTLPTAPTRETRLGAAGFAAAALGLAGLGMAALSLLTGAPAAVPAAAALLAIAGVAGLAAVWLTLPHSR